MEELGQSEPDVGHGVRQQGGKGLQEVFAEGLEVGF